MRILVLGNTKASEDFFKLFKSNEENIVFSTIEGLSDFSDFKDSSDIIEFCEANEINLVLIADEKYIKSELEEALAELNISVFSPSVGAADICLSKCGAKKFIYRNKIKTPRFQIAEKPQQAMEYIKTVQMPLAIKPDNSSYKECTQFCETRVKAEKIVNDFFASGNKKIIIEDYIEGKNISVWALSDGYSAKIIGKSAKYQDNVASFEPDFITPELMESIYDKIINPTINALNAQNEEYIGILGFDIILTYDGGLYLLGYKSFFDDINAPFFTECFDVKWEDVFESTIIGDVFLKYQIEPVCRFALSLRENDEIKFLSAQTKTNLELYLKELNYDLKEYKEAIKIWRY